MISRKEKNKIDEKMPTLNLLKGGNFGMTILFLLTNYVHVNCSSFLRAQLPYECNNDSN